MLYYLRVNTKTPTKTEQVRQHVISMIRDGLGAHSQLPTEREMAENLGISRLTIRRALSTLENDGVIYRVQGSGTFVSEQRVRKSFELNSFSEDMKNRGYSTRALTVEVRQVPAGPKIGYELEIAPTDMVVHIKRVRAANDTPVCVENAYIPLAIAPNLTQETLGDSLYETLDKSYGARVERADQIIEAAVLTPQEAEILQAPAFSAAFHILRTGYDTRGRAVEYSDSIYRGDRYDFRLPIHRRTTHESNEA